MLFQGEVVEVDILLRDDLDLVRLFNNSLVPEAVENALHEGGFATAVVPQQAHHLVVGVVQIQLIQDLVLPVAERNIGSSH